MVVVSQSYAATLPKRPHRPARLNSLGASLRGRHPQPRARRSHPGLSPGLRPSDNYLVQWRACEAGVGAMIAGRVAHRFALPSSIVPLGSERYRRGSVQLGPGCERYGSGPVQLGPGCERYGGRSVQLGPGCERYRRPLRAVGTGLRTVGPRVRAVGTGLRTVGPRVRAVGTGLRTVRRPLRAVGTGLRTVRGTAGVRPAILRP